jgi:large subunit ribosomal protein L24
MLKLKKGDTIRVTTGKDKGREGKVDFVDKTALTVLVTGVNVYKRHIGKARTRDGKGQIFELSRPLAFSKVMLLCPKCKKPTRVGFVEKDGKKLRTCKHCKESFI